MPNSIVQIPVAYNEPVFSYMPGSKEKIAVKKALAEFKSQSIDIPMFINGKKITSGTKVAVKPPHEINHTLGFFNKGDESHINMAIDAALKAKKSWEDMPWEQRAAIFLKAAEYVPLCSEREITNTSALAIFCKN